MKEDIRSEFVRGYFDLGIYRFVVRNWRVLKPVGYTAFGILAASILLASTGVISSKMANIFIAIAGTYLVGLAWLAAIDHIIIGASIKRVLKKLERKGIVITAQTLLNYCQDILPK
jgi:hypothetical protein